MRLPLPPVVEALTLTGGMLLIGVAIGLCGLCELSLVSRSEIDVGLEEEMIELEFVPPERDEELEFDAVLELGLAVNGGSVMMIGLKVLESADEFLAVDIVPDDPTELGVEIRLKSLPPFVDEAPGVLRGL